MGVGGDRGQCVVVDAGIVGAWWVGSVGPSAGSVCVCAAQEVLVRKGVRFIRRGQYG